MKINPKFPPSRETDARRRAERHVYQALETSEIPGWTLYEVKVTREAPQIDFLVWVEGIGVFAVQLKGGVYVIRDGELCLLTGQGLFPKEGLLAKVWDSSRAVPEFIQDKLHRGLYIIPVLGLPDMERDEDILDMAARRQVEVVFGKDNWVQRLVDLARCHPIRHRPTEESIEREVMAIMPELAPAASPAPPQVVIHRVDQLHIHVGPEGIETLGLQDLKAED